MSIVLERFRALARRAALLAAAAAIPAALTSCSFFNTLFHSPSSNDTTPPTVTGTISSSMTGADTVHLSWTAATDNSTSQANIQYEVVDSSSPITSVSAAEALTPAKVPWTSGITSADVAVSHWDAAGSFHYFAVLAKDSTGNTSLYPTNAKRQVNLYDVVAVTPSGVQVFQNDGNGVLSPSGSKLLDSSNTGTYTNLALGNITNHPASPDGGPAVDDIFLTKNAGYNEVWTNSGAGSFTEKSEPNLKSGISPIPDYTAVALGKITASGNLDAFVSIYGYNGRVFDNDGTGNYSLDSASENASLISTTTTVIDVTGIAMGRLTTAANGQATDVFAATDNGSGGAAKNALWLNQPYSSTYTYNPQATTTTSTSTNVAMADLDGDGINDLFVTNTGVNEVWKNDGGGLGSSLTAIAEGQFQAHDSTAVALGDLNGDGTIDAFVVNSGSPDTVWNNNGTGVFSQFNTPNVSSVSASDLGTDVVLADLNGDGILDAVVSSGGSSGTIRVWLGNGDGTFTQVSETQIPNADYVAVAVGRLR